MNFKNRIAAITGGVALVALAGACNKDLNVTNPNAPDVARAVSSPGDVRNLIGNSYNTWFMGAHGSAIPDGGIMVAVMADNLTMAFGNFGARFNGQEPRLAYNNSSAASDGLNASRPWDRMYGALGAANDGLNAIKRGVVVAVSAGATDETPQFQSFAYMIQGLSLGYIGLTFDRGFVVDEETVQGTATLKPYKDVAAASVAKFEKAIASASGKTWTIPTSFTPGTTLTAAKFVQANNTFAARVLAYTARTEAENKTANWAKVLDFANKGISSGTPFNVSIEGDGGTTWYDLLKYYGESQSWVRVDQRVVQLLDPTQPVVYTSVTPPSRAQSADKRMGTTATPGTDFKFVTNIPFAAARGVYFFSQWQHIRYFQHSFEDVDELKGIMPWVLAAENDLLIAEALVRTNGDKNRAATLINNTRVTRGGLAPMTAANSSDELLGAIFYERDVELMNTGVGQPWYDRRRIDASLVHSGIPIGNTWGFRGGSGLQKGTPRSIPIPAKELETLGIPVYTFGGAAPNPVFPEM